MTVTELLKAVPFKEQKIMSVIRFMTDNRLLDQGVDMKLKIRSSGGINNV